MVTTVNDTCKRHAAMRDWGEFIVATFWPQLKSDDVENGIGVIIYK